MVALEEETKANALLNGSQQVTLALPGHPMDFISLVGTEG